MRYSRVLVSVAVLALRSVVAQEPQPSVSVALSIDRDAIYQYESFDLVVTVTSSGVRLGQDLTLNGMPEPDTLVMAPMKALPIQRTLQDRTILEKRQYRARCRPLKAGTLRLAHSAMTTRIVQRRSFFGHHWVEAPLQLTVPPVEIAVRALPPPPDGRTPSGAVGTFTFSVVAEPLDVAVGDLIKLRTRIAGDGHLEDVQCPAVAAGPAFKTYPPRPLARTDTAVEFEQAIIPLNEQATRIPALAFTSFNARLGAYQTQTQGPFRVTFHAPREVDRTQPYRSATRQGQPVPALTLADRIDRWKQQPAPRGNETAIVIEPVPARLAPASVARALFTCKPGDIVTLIEETEGWLCIQHRRDLGWIPARAVMRR